MSKLKPLLLIAKVILLLLYCCCTIKCDAQSRKNILFVMADDLRADYVSQIVNDDIPDDQIIGNRAKSGIRRLAKTGLTFARAYVQIGVCAPSRNGILSGRRPDTTRSWNFISSLRGEPAIQVQTIPEVLKNAGYFTISIGKVFHMFDPPILDDGKRSWSTESLLPAARNDESKDCPGENLICECVNKQCVDEQITDKAIEILKRWEASENFKQPFFMGVGYRRPHTDYLFPKAFADKFLPKNLPIAEQQFPSNFRTPTGLPSTSFYSCDNMVAYAGLKKEIVSPFTKVSDGNAKTIRDGYFASAAYMDVQFGELLRYLDGSEKFRSNTIVLFMSDHGFSLGENGMWCKQSVREVVTRIPLIIRAPWIKASENVKITHVVEAIDVFPTILSLADDSRGSIKRQTNACFQGKDLSVFFSNPFHYNNAEKNSISGNILNDATMEYSNQIITRKSWALSQYPRCFMINVPDNKNPWLNPCTKDSANVYEYMGYSLRVTKWRYTEWRVWKKTMADWSEDGLNSSELYSFDGENLERGVLNFNEWENENVQDRFPNIARLLSKALRRVVLDTEVKNHANYDSARCELKRSFTESPSNFPTLQPTMLPTIVIATKRPTKTKPPTVNKNPPSSSSPSLFPSSSPSKNPVTAPTSQPPTKHPSNSPTSSSPTFSPSVTLVTTTTIAPSPVAIPPSTCQTEQETCEQHDWNCGMPIKNNCANLVNCTCWAYILPEAKEKETKTNSKINVSNNHATKPALFSWVAFFTTLFGVWWFLVV